MNASIPRRLMESREFRGLGTLARVVLRLIWRRGEERRWSREELLAELQTRGLFLGRVGFDEFETTVAELLVTGALEPDPDAAAPDTLLLPVLSADTPRDARSESPAARRKREQRDRDRKNPELVAARQANRQAPSPDAQSAPTSTAPTRPAVEPPSARDTGRDISRDTSTLSHPDVTVTGHVTVPVTVTPSGVGGGERGGEENSSSSSSSFSEETWREQRVTAREGAPARGEAPVTVVTGGVTGSVTPSVTGGVTPPVTGSGAAGEAADAAPITGQEITHAFETHAPDRVNCVAPGRIVDRAEDLCRAQRLTRAELDTMARMAGRGELVGQDKRKVTDLTMLVGGREGEGGLLALWMGAARAAHAAAAKERAREARLAANQQRGLPYGAGAGAAPGRFTPPVVARAGAANDGRGRDTG